MKRSGGLRRHTPLKPGRPLKRCPLIVTPEQVEKQRARQQQRRIQALREPCPGPARTPARRGKSVGEGCARRLVKRRSGGLCEIRLPGCMVRAVDFHHRKLAGQGGRWCPGNGLHCCRPCHRAVTNTNGHRPEYEDKGWIVPAHVERPAMVKVYRWEVE